MKDNKEKAKNLIILGIVIVIFSVCMIQLNIGNEKIQSVNAQIGDNKTIGWGIKRNNNNIQPDVGANNKKILEENGGICLGKDNEKNIYLTFDAGYEAGHTEKILDVLKENDVKATFFITSHYLNTASDKVERMINEEIEKEIMRLHQAVYEKFNYEMKYIRPPKGEFNERTLKKCEELGYKTVMWSFAYCDWDEKKQPSLEEGKKMITQNFHSGEIILLHSNSKTNSEVLDTIIKEAKNQGYEFKSLEQFK